MSAPGAKCPDCILAARRAREAAKAPAAASTPAPTAPDVVKARDTAIVDALRLRRWNRPGLLTVLPQEPGQTAHERARALDTALLRLSVKAQIRKLPDETYELR